MSQAQRACRGLAVSISVAPLLAGCGGIQSVLSPHTETAEQAYFLGLIMFIAAAVIFLLVFAIAVGALHGPERLRAAIATNRAIVAGGVVFPIVTLTVLLAYGLSMMGGDLRASSDPIEIEVVGEQWWWRVRYATPEGPVEGANEVHVPVGRSVRLTLRSQDVIHSFWVPTLAGKMDMIPGRATTLTFTVPQPGVYRGQCAEYCGGAHALMAFRVVAQLPDDFDAWLKHAAQPADPPETPTAQEGQNLFLTRGCSACHTIRGADAGGRVAPDLTHVAGRAALAAELLVNTPANLALWIRESQQLKPNNHMPSFDDLAPDHLAAIVAYLSELK